MCHPRIAFPQYSASSRSYRSRQSSLGLDQDDDRLLKSTPTLHPELTRTEADDSLVKAIKNLRHRLHGWRFGVLLSSATASFVLLANCIAAIVIHFKYDTHDGISTAFDGDCHIADRWSLGLHIVINALSSLLLSASNYTMQVLNAPTRSECDRAHIRGDCLDVGIPSLRNISKITWPRRLLWLLLGFSSVPIHLLYNSAAFKTIDTNAYHVVFATPLFLQSDALPPPFINESELYSGQEDHYVSETIRQAYYSRELDFVNLTAAECINTYGVDFMSGHSDVIALTDGIYPPNVSVEKVASSTPMFGSGFWDPYAWMCATLQASPFHCDVSRLKTESSSWKVDGLPIGYCLARKAEQHCKLKFSRGILVAVIICNLCKAAAMVATLLLQREPTLVTTGDAISSWLHCSDEATANQCLQRGKRNVRTKSSESLLPYDAPSVDDWSPVLFRRSRVLRWHQAIDYGRWAAVLTLCIITLAAAGGLIAIAHKNFSRTGQDTIHASGFGAIAPGSMISAAIPDRGMFGLMANVFIANSPQLICSCLYLLYNGLFTSMCLADEYSNYSVRRKALRVTSPHGGQRSTHWLHLPYFYGVPLLAASALLHWSISQSIFFVGIDIYRDAELEHSKFGLGYSVQPIILDIVLGSCMLLVLVGMGFRKLQGEIPLASSNSYAISAACHRPEEDTDAALKPVMWGEVQTGSDSEVGHCCFTSMEVTAPVEGRMYAGLRKREGVTKRSF